MPYYMADAYCQVSIVHDLSSGIGLYYTNCICEEVVSFLTSSHIIMIKQQVFITSEIIITCQHGNDS